MAISETPYVGDIGTKIYVDCAETISSASTTALYVRKPDKTEVVWIPTIYDATTLVYTTVEGDFDQEGEYRLNANVTLSTTEQFTGKVDKFTVHERYF